MTPSEWIMVLACLLFVLAGIITFLETRNWRISAALICIGVANALLLWEASV